MRYFLVQRPVDPDYRTAREFAGTLTESIVMGHSILGWILFASVAMLAISVVMGDHHFEIGGDAGHGGADMGGDIQHGISMSEILNLRSLALLGVGFSAATMLAQNSGFGISWSYLTGIIGAICFIALGVFLFRLIRNQESNSITTNKSLVGGTAKVVSSIPQNGLGEIILRNELGAAVSLSATTNGADIKSGVAVKILAVSGNLATVELAR
jgi:membrane protein implicated in regulation of membrane protease activity